MFSWAWNKKEKSSNTSDFIWIYWFLLVLDGKYLYKSSGIFQYILANTTSTIFPDQDLHLPFTSFATHRRTEP